MPKGGFEAAAHQWLDVGAPASPDRIHRGTIAIAEANAGAFPREGDRILVPYLGSPLAARNGL
jgi:hypothetical protein